MTQAAEQQSEITTEVSSDEQIPGQVEDQSQEVSEAVEEFEIVLAGQDEPTGKPEAKSSKDFILNRVMRKKEKLADENALLRQQLESIAKPQAASVEARPDEYAFEDRQEYLQADAKWQSQMLSNAVSEQLNHQQNGHRQQAAAQEVETALTSYAENAAKLKVSNFNEVQDKAFDVLGDEFAQMIARELPDDGPKLIYHLGLNPQEAVRLRDEYKVNPGKTTFSLGKLASNLTVKRKESTAAQPESKVESGAVGGINEDWQAAYDKIMDAADSDNIGKSLRQIRTLKTQAKAAGFDTSTLK